MSNIDENGKERIPKAVLAEMWQFFLTTSVPIILAEHEERKEMERLKRAKKENHLRE